MATDDNHNQVSLTVFGATGFTARFVLQTIVDQIQEIVSSGDDANFTWSIAGRNAESLDKIRGSLKDKITNDKWVPSVVVADVKDTASLKRMAARTRLLLNCVGPYYLHGEAVVKAVLSANESRGDASPTDYIDLSGEPAWIEEMVLRYSDRATRLNCSIVHAAAFDSVPSDFGHLLAKQRLDGTPTSIETFVRLHSRSSQRLGIHYATYEAAVHGFSTRKNLSVIRRTLYSKLPKLEQPSVLALGEGDVVQRSTGLPKRKGALGGAITRIPSEEPHVGNTYVIPFFFADPAVVRLSQHLSASLSQSDQNPPVKAAAFWFVIPSLPILLVTLCALTLFGIMASFELGRSVLLKYPEVFSAGMVSHNGPTKEQLEDYSFSTIVVARGYSRAAQADDKILQPDVKTVVRIRGPEVGYVSTPILFINVARTFLAERSKINNGVLTPGSALLRTTLLDRLNKEGKVTFSVVSS